MIVIEDINETEREDKPKCCLIYALDQKPAYQPLGLGHIAAEMKRKGYSYSFYTLIVQDDKQTSEWISNLDADVFLLSVYDWNIPSTTKIVNEIRKGHPGKKIILGGNACYAANEIFNKINPDVLVIGEGEQTIIELLERKKTIDAIRGIAYKKENAIIINPERTASDINAIASPYIESVFNERFYGNQAAFMLTRGCTFKCTYCLWGSPKEAGKFRHKNVELALEELKVLWQQGVRRIHPQDAIFNFSTEYLKKLADDLERKNMHFQWNDADCRADLIDEEQVKTLKRLGVFEVGLGLETTNPDTQKRIKKFLDTEKVKEAVRLLRKHHMKIHVSFQVGLPEETEEDVLKTFKFVKSLKTDEVGIFHTRVQPGTELYNTAERQEKTSECGLGVAYYSKNKGLKEEDIPRLIDSFFKELQPISTKVNLLVGGNHYPHKIHKKDNGNYEMTIYIREVREKDSLRGVDEIKDMLKRLDKILIKSDDQCSEEAELVLCALKTEFPGANFSVEKD
jgi:radical SAM superfamily enzyme YgiQ (UPF0313 family)